jgi:hypothetical protein
MVEAASPIGGDVISVRACMSSIQFKTAQKQSTFYPALKPVNLPDFYAGIHKIRNDN